MTQSAYRIQAVVFDWAGTTIDYGSRAPAIVFQQVFRERGIKITVDQARGPMGMAKRAHIASIAALPEISQEWTAQHGSPPTDADIDAMYDEFLPLQKSVLKEHCQLIPGVTETIEHCRSRGLRIGSSTGYTRELMEVVSAAAKERGYEPDCVLCAEDAPAGRPAPYLLFESAIRLGVFPMWSFIKVDDTTVGIEAGINAGCWTVGVTLSGNLTGLSEAEVADLTASEKQQYCDRAEEKLRAAGAHYVMESVADFPQVLEQIVQRAANGERPV